MKYTYLENFTKTSVDNMESVQEVITTTGAIVDSKLFPLIDEAEKGDFGAMAELYEMFTFGENDVTPNYKMALRYWTKLHFSNIDSEDKAIISEGLNNHVYLHLQFDKMEEATESLEKAFKFMVTHFEAHEWDAQLIKLMAENIEVYQNDDSTE